MAASSPAVHDDALDLDFLRTSAREYLTGRADVSIEDLAGMDWTGLLVDEALGGAGWRPVEAAVVAEELGRARDRSTWFGTTLAAAALATASRDVRDRWLPALLDGTAPAGVAPAAPTVRVTGADTIRVVVRLGPRGIHLCEVSDTTPVEPDDELLDVTRPAWRVHLSDADGLLIGGFEHADRLLATARVLLSADSLGAVSDTFERLVEYLGERVAFGTSIASFQAVQHRLVDLLVFQTKARAVVTKAARALAPDAPAESAFALAAAAHAFVAAKATAAVDECMQLSGGIGFTWDYPLHHALRRTFTNAQLLGTARSSRADYADGSGW